MMRGLSQQEISRLVKTVEYMAGCDGAIRAPEIAAVSESKIEDVAKIMVILTQHQMIKMVAGGYEAKPKLIRMSKILKRTVDSDFVSQTVSIDPEIS